MVNNQKQLAIFEAMVIVILLFVVIGMYYKNEKIKMQNIDLLSPKICAGIDEPKSFSILDFTPLQNKVQKYINDNHLNVSVYVKNYRNGASMGINANEGYFPASLNKLPVAILIMEKIENGDLTFDTLLNITDDDKKNTSGDIYKTQQKQMPVRILLEKMLKDSDNTAFSVLLGYTNPNDLKILLDYLGIDIYTNYHVKVFAPANTTLYISPRLMYNIFSSLYYSTVLEPKNSQYILSLLTNTVFDIKKAAELPDDVIVSQKFGESYSDNNRYFHSCGIMYIGKSKIFYCVMTKDVPFEEAKKTVGNILHDTYKYVVETRSKLDKYKVYVENS